MPVDARISLITVQRELKECQEDCKRYHWEISNIDEQNQTFIVKMKSPIDNELYVIEIKFDNYNEWPPYIEFIDPISDQRGTKKSYPLSSGGDYGSFFHPQHPSICHPCSRKAYQGYTGLHGDWNITGWQQNPYTGTLTNIRAILLAIYGRISNRKTYGGRMFG